MSHLTLVILIAAAALAPAIVDVFSAVRCAFVPCRCRRSTETRTR
jgi:hypothetical protein